MNYTWRQANREQQTFHGNALTQTGQFGLVSNILNRNCLLTRQIAKYDIFSVMKPL